MPQLPLQETSESQSLGGLAGLSVGFLWSFCFACTGFSMATPAIFGTPERLQEARSSCISNFKTGRQQNNSQQEKAKLKAKTWISACSWALCVPWSLRSQCSAASLQGLQSILYILLHERKVFNVTLSFSTTSILYMPYIDKLRWKMAVAQMCLRATIAK